MVVVVSHDPAFLVGFAEWSLRGRLLVWSTRLLVVTRLALPQLRTLLPAHWTFSMMNAVFLNVEGDASYLKCVGYTYLPYSPVGASMEKVGVWTPRGSLNLGRGVLPFTEKFVNFYGTAVNVTALPYMPFWSEVKNQATDGSSVTKVVGSDYQLLMAVATALNFTIRILPSASWAEATRQVEKRVSFMCPVYHIIMTVRAKVYGFTYAYEYSHFSFAMAKPGRKPQWQSLYYPMSHQVWMAVAATLLVVPLIYTMITYIHQKIHEGQRRSVGKVMLNMVGLMMRQSFSYKPSSAFSSRILMTSWLILVVIFSWSYSGNLTASLTVPKYSSRPETLSQLVKTVDKVTIPSYGESHLKFYRESNSPLFNTLAKLLEVGPNLMEGLSGALQHKRAHLGGRRFLKYHIADKFTAVDGSSRLYVGRETLFPGAAGWPIPHDAPYKTQLDHCIMSVVETGLYEKWAATLVRETNLKSRQRQRHSEAGKQRDVEMQEVKKGSPSLTINHMQGAFMLLLLGLLVATLAFVEETLQSLAKHFSNLKHRVSCGRPL